jgi:hypothetical protein
MPSPTSPPEATGRHQRSIRNYLLDAPFQLKYTSYLVAIAIILSGALGALLWKTSDDMLVQSRTSVAQGFETVRRGKELVKTSQKLSAVVQMNIAEKYADSPDLAKVFNEGADKEQKRLEEEQARLEAESARLLAHERDIERQQSRIMATLLVTLTTLVLFIGAAGIVITHKIAGPIFKMKRQIRELGEGKLAMPGKLRKGDELVHFFQEFEDSVKHLRSQQSARIAELDAAIAKAEAGDSADAATRLKALRERLADQLGLSSGRRSHDCAGDLDAHRRRFHIHGDDVDAHSLERAVEARLLPYPLRRSAQSAALGTADGAERRLPRRPPARPHLDDDQQRALTSKNVHLEHSEADVRSDDREPIGDEEVEGDFLCRAPESGAVVHGFSLTPSQLPLSVHASVPVSVSLTVACCEHEPGTYCVFSLMQYEPRS